jgi:uncharacterized membrane protein YkvA (DUF1232 family)
VSGATAAAGLKRWADALRRDATTLWLAARDPRLPWPAKAVCAVAAAYALSPIDLIPDFIPVLGLLDELVLLPLALWLALRMIPSDLAAELRAEAAGRAGRPVSRTAAVLIIAVWLLGGVLAAWALTLRLRGAA